MFQKLIPTLGESIARVDEVNDGLLLGLRAPLVGLGGDDSALAAAVLPLLVFVS